MGERTMSGEFVYRESTTDDRSGDVDSCPECGNETLYADDVRGELVCDDCGYILKNGLIARGPEWTAFSQEEREKRSRVGAPLTETVHDRGLTTHIHWKDIDAHGRSLPSKKRKQMKRLRKWQTRIRTEGAGERNLQLAFVEIHRMSSALGLPQPVRESAAVIYRRALDENLIRGRSIEAVAASSLYIACRNEEIPRSLDEFDDVARVDRAEIGRSYRYLASELDMEMEPVDPRKFVPRFCSELELEKPIQRTAVDVLDRTIEEELHSGKSPTSLAAAAIYTASILEGVERTQSEVAEVANVTEVTIRNRYREQISLIDA